MKRQQLTNLLEYQSQGNPDSEVFISLILKHGEQEVHVGFEITGVAFPITSETIAIQAETSIENIQNKLDYIKQHIPKNEVDQKQHS